MAKKKDEMIPDMDVVDVKGKFYGDNQEIEKAEVEVIHKMKPTHVSVDFPSEGLNNLARKINEIIDYL